MSGNDFKNKLVISVTKLKVSTLLIIAVCRTHVTRKALPLECKNQSRCIFRFVHHLFMILPQKV